MIKYSTNMDANEYLQQLVGQPLRYGLKSPNLDLFDFGFGEYTQRIRLDGTVVDFPSYVLHATCDFKVIWRNKSKHIDYYNGETPANQFYLDIQSLISLNVQRVALSDKNDLWLDFGQCWVVFITFETNQESWRFFTSNEGDMHLVAADSWLQMVGQEEY